MSHIRGSREEAALIAEALRARARTHSGRAGYAGRYGPYGYGHAEDMKRLELDKAAKLRKLAARFEALAND